MPLSRTRDYLSIGEVLSSLKDDFPDVSISKIRFLESEGLISPERTGAGYRKFYEKDVARLRFILGLQRDHFLPLRVIRQRLAEAGDNLATVPAPASNGGKGSATSKLNELTSVSLDLDELRSASGLSDAEFAGLLDYGIVSAQGPYDEHDLAVAKAAKRFFDFGIEPRHLRMYKQFADREASLFEQIVSPISRRRDPAARDQAQASVVELATLSRQIKEAALRSTLRELLS